MSNPKFVCLLFLLFLNQPRLSGADDGNVVSVDQQANLDASEVAPTQPSVSVRLASDATFNQTHAFIRTTILDERVAYEQPMDRKSSGQFEHWHEVNYDVTVYSANKCRVVYGRVKSRPEVHGHAAYSSKKGVSFDMTRVDRVALQPWSNFDPTIGRSNSKLSEMIMFYGPATVISDGVASERTSHGLPVYSASSEQILNAFQHLKLLCTP